MKKDETIRITVLLKKSVLIEMKTLLEVFGGLPQSTYCASAIKNKNEQIYSDLSAKQKEHYLKLKGA